MRSRPERESLERWAGGLGLNLGTDQWRQLEDYLRQVSEHSRKVNITSDSGSALFLRHAADALAALPVLRRRLGPIPNPSVLDLGAGAGFIGITLKIAWPEAEVTLLESSERKFRFLNWASAKLETPGLHVILGRAPSALLDGKLFDAVLVRALASWEQSARLGLSLAKSAGGFCILYQTRPPPNPDVSVPGARVLEILPYRLPAETRDRHLVVLERMGL